jgi:hypothetical protein
MRVPFAQNNDRVATRDANGMAGMRNRRRSRKRKCENENDQQTHDGAHDAVSHNTKR